MKHYLVIAALLLLPSIALADKQCEKDADGQVECTQVSEEQPSQPGAVREGDDADSSDASSTQDDDNEPSVGDQTSQSRDPGMKY
ncbi:hypothetical protein [Salinisphaera sp. T31B1]|uniref:hypothetical protein n=1 Tax=Salinisphaera sp. T31B1 TaxID=727963 RepID=UPI00333F686B